MRMTNSVVRSALAILCAVTVLTACSEPSTDTTGGVITSGKPSLPTSVAIKKLPQSTLLDWVTDKEVLTDSIEGPRIINFWASWCGPCKEEMPLLQASFTANEVIGVNAQDAGESSYAREAANAVLRDTGVTYPIYIDQDDKLIAALGINAFPVTIVINKDGEVITRIDGLITEEKIVTLRNALNSGGS